MAPEVFRFDHRRVAGAAWEALRSSVARHLWTPARVEQHLAATTDPDELKALCRDIAGLPPGQGRLIELEVYESAWKMPLPSAAITRFSVLEESFLQDAPARYRELHGPAPDEGQSFEI